MGGSFAGARAALPQPRRAHRAEGLLAHLAVVVVEHERALHLDGQKQQHEQVRILLDGQRSPLMLASHRAAASTQESSRGRWHSTVVLALYCGGATEVRAFNMLLHEVGKRGELLLAEHGLDEREDALIRLP